MSFPQGICVSVRRLSNALKAAALALLLLPHAIAQSQTPLSAPWQPLGPSAIASATYGNVSGRVSALALDPADPIGNTLYVGTTGGGVWKSTNAAGPPAQVTFTPLTDNLPVFNASSGTAALPSLTIGALSAHTAGGLSVLLAGTGDPNNSADSFYGTGILRSTDGGTTWTLIPSSRDSVAGNHSFFGLATAGFAWSTTTPTLVVAAMSDSAEGLLVNAPAQTYSIPGLYYSTDSGVTWKMSTLMDGSQTVQRPLPADPSVPGNAATAVVWNPLRARFYAAVRFHGYYESPDGVTWTRLTAQPGPALTLAACPTNPGLPGSPSCPLFRGALAVQPLTGDTFALTADLHNADQGLFEDACALSSNTCAAPLAFATQIPSAPLDSGTTIPQADYNLTLAALPTTTSGSPDTLLFAGTTDLFRCTLAGGCTLRNTTNAANGCNTPAGVAPAQHALAGLTGVPSGLLFLSNDGGLWRSTDGVNQQASPCNSDDATHFQNLNATLGSLAETVSLAQHPADPNTLLAGFGANGTAATSTANTRSPWPQLSAGEGGTVAIDPVTPNNWYLSTTAGVSIAHCGNGVACTPADFAAGLPIGEPQVSLDAALLDPPWLIDPADPADLVIGTCRVWRGPATAQSSWNPSNAISRAFSGPQNASCAAGSNALVRSLALGGPASGAAAAQNAGSPILYAGLAGGGGSAAGHLFATTAGAIASSTTAWTDLAASPVTNGGAFNASAFDISSVTTDPHDPTGATVYATIQGFGVPHLFRSTDTGAHWTNLSANLPDAPANALAVDPGNANTVYVALDTGVYVTQAIATCASANCWSLYGTALPNSPVVQLLASATLANGSGTTGTLRAGTYGRGLWQLPLLSSSTPATQAAITLAPTALAFPAQQVATTSTPQTLTVTNSGTAALTITSLTTTGDFTQTSTCLGTAIAPAATCTVQVTFAPSATGPRNGLLTIFANVPGGQATAALTGTGSAAASIVLLPLSLTFPATPLNTTTAAQNITISNTGGNPAALTSETVTGDFRLSANTCTSALGSQSGCTVSVVFTPTASGPRTGTLTVTDSAGTQTATLSGTGTSPATDTLAPLALTFAPQVLNTASPSQPVTLTNSGDTALTLINPQITAGDFTVTNACGNSLNPHSACTLNVAFAPHSLGPQTGTLTLTDQFRIQIVSLNGTGLAPAGVSLAPLTGLAFAPLGLTLTSPAQTVTLTNNGGVPLLIASISPTGDFALVPGSNTCPTTLPVASACTLQIAFTPTATGPRAGSLTVTDSAASSPQSLALSGTGVDFTLTVSNPTVTVASGTSAIYSLLLTSAAGVPGTAALTCTGAPTNATCLIVPANAPLGTGTATVVVTVATGVATAANTLPASPWLHNTLYFALVLPLGTVLLPIRRRKLATLLAALILCAFTASTGCGVGRAIPNVVTVPAPVSPNPTPVGTYTLPIAATSAGLTRTVTLTLVVQ